MIPYKPASRISLPDPGQLDVTDADAVRRHLSTLNGAVAQLSQDMMVRTQPVDQLLLMSPNGSTYALRISNLGVLSTTVVNAV